MKTKTHKIAKMVDLYVCETCNFESSDRWKMNKHENGHTEDKCKKETGHAFFSYDFDVEENYGGDSYQAVVSAECRCRYKKARYYLYNVEGQEFNKRLFELYEECMK